MARIAYERDRLGNYIVSNNGDDRTLYVQADYERCGLAYNFGWSPCCAATDGTVDCEHGTADMHIASATEFLMDHEDEMAEDPGYFPDQRTYLGDSVYAEIDCLMVRLTVNNGAGATETIYLDDDTLASLLAFTMRHKGV